MEIRNVLGGPLETCGTEPLTGFYRDGCCRTGTEDVGSHTICAVVSAEFLAYQQSIGNDLSTPVPAYGFPGLNAGDRWCVTARNWYSSYLSWTGDYPLAIEQAKAAIALDPLNARSFEGLGARFYTARRYSEAIAECSRAVELNVTMPSAYYMRALALMWLERYEEAFNDLSLAEAHGGARHPSVLVARAFCLHRAARPEEADKVLEQLTQSHPSSYDLAEGFAACDRIEEALQQLERAVNERAPELVGIHGEPLFDSIRDHPRFKQVASRLGIPTTSSAVR